VDVDQRAMSVATDYNRVTVNSGLA